MSAYDDLFNLFGVPNLGGLVEPKDEHHLSLDRRIANRIRVNNYILLHLSKAAS